MPPRRYSRREFCREAALLVGGAFALSACAPTSPNQPMLASNPPTPYLRTPDPNALILPGNYNELSSEGQDTALFQTALYDTLPPVFLAGPNELPPANIANLSNMPCPSIIPGYENSAPSEAEYMKAISDMNLAQASNVPEIDLGNLAENDVDLVLAGLVGTTVAARPILSNMGQTPFAQAMASLGQSNAIKALAAAETVALLDVVPGDELVIGGILLAVAAGVVAGAYYSAKFDKNARQVHSGRKANKNGHSHPTHDPKDPNKGHVARRIIYELSQRGPKAATTCFLVQAASGALRVLVTSPVLGTADTLAHLAWYIVDPNLNPQSGWGGAYTYSGNAKDAYTALTTANWGEKIQKITGDVCASMPMPAPNKYR